jgi:hypothetical protein
MNLKRIAWISLVIFICSFLVWKFSSNEKPTIPTNDDTKKVLKVEQISTDFNLNKFSSNQEVALLKEIGICDSTQANDNNLDNPSCSPRFFRFFKLNKSKPLRDGFMLLVRAGVNKFPVRRLLIFERENGQLVKTNGFVGYIIERRVVASNYDDIVVRFFERYENQKYFYNCLYTWKNGRYVYQKCEAINDAKLKPEKADSVSIEVEKILNENKLIF